MAPVKGQLSLAQGIGFLISTLLGCGVFIVPAMVAGISGQMSWLAWLSMTILVLPVLLVFSWLGKAFPHAAGTAHFVELAFGQGWSACISILYLAIVPIGPPVAILTGANYLAFCFGLPASDGWIFAGLMVGLILLINFFNIVLAGNIQLLISVLTTVILGLVIVSGLLFTPHDTVTLPLTHDWQWSAIAQAMGIIFWCFVGIEAMAHIAPEFRHPQRDFPLTIGLSVTVAVVLYALLSYTVLKFHAFGSEAANIASLPMIIRQTFGNLGASVIGFIGFMTCLGAVNLYIVSLSRLLASLSEAGLVARVFCHHNRQGAPIVAMLTILSVVLLTMAAKYLFDVSLNHMIVCANGVFIAIYLASSLSAVRLLSHGQRWVAGLASLFCLAVMVCLHSDMWYAAMVVVLGGIWVSVKRRRGRVAPAQKIQV